MTDTTDDTDLLLIDIDGDDVHFATCKPASHAALENYRAYRSGDFATGTDCIMEFARDVGLSLERRRAGVVASGAVGADSIRIARSRWIISRTGLELLFGAKPVFINDSVAKAWVNFASNGDQARLIGGDRRPDFSRAGKIVVLNYAAGLGAGVLHVQDSGAVSVTDTECGHIGFAPQNDIEREIAQQLARTNPRVTYERMLQIERDDPLWSILSRPVQGREQDEVRAAILGSFAGDLILAYTGWAGIFLDGERCEFLAEPALATIFNTRFEDKGHFRMNVRAAPRWLAPKSANNLQGAARMLSASH